MGKVFSLEARSNKSGLQLQSIEVTKMPDKLIYNSGEVFNPTGMIVTATYDKGATAIATGYLYTPTTLKYGDSEITIVYTDELVTVQTTIQITVNRVQVSIPTQVGTITYDGNEKYPTWSTYDSNFMSIFGDVSGTDAGSYLVEFSLDSEHEWNDGSTSSKTVTWMIKRASILEYPVQRGVLTYNKNSQSPNWDNYDSNEITISEPQSEINAGKYIAKFTPTQNYQWPDKTIGTKDIPWLINKADSSISLDPTSLTFNSLNKVKEISITTNGEGAISAESSNAEVATVAVSSVLSITSKSVGTAMITVKVSESINTLPAEATASITIVRTKLDIPSVSSSLTYTGSGQSPSWSNYDESLLTIDGTISATDAGTYTAIFSIKNTDSYEWPDGTQDAKSVDWSIQRIKIETYPSQSGTLYYNAKSQSPTWNNYDPNKLTISGTVKMMGAGEYIAKFTPTQNYEWSDGKTDTKDITWTINKSNPYNSSNVVSSLKSLSGDQIKINRLGTGTLSAESSNEEVVEVSVSGLSTIWLSGKSAGTATITIHIDEDANTTSYDGTRVITVTRQVLTVPSTTSSFTYTGSSQSPVWTNYDAETLTIGGTYSAVNAGNYSATFTIKQSNYYEWSDGTTTAKSVNWSIAKVDGSVSFSPSSIVVTSDDNGKTVTVTRAGDGAITATSNNTSIVSIALSGTEITVTGIKTGSTTVNVSVAEGTNHKAVSGSFTVSMTKYKDVSKTEIITTSGTWTNTTGSELSAKVMCFGGGGGAYAESTVSGGGGGGYMSTQTVTLAANASVNVTIGSSGTNSKYTNGSAASNGGTTSFGTYVSANGGKTSDNYGAGGDGGTGGGSCVWRKTNNPNVGAPGGDGQYGGGGGGGGGECTTYSKPNAVAGGNGGSGGSYGGGGGGGGASNNNSQAYGSYTSANGGSGGYSSSYGRGGAGGGINVSSTQSIASDGVNGSAGENTNSVSGLDFVGSGSAGSGYKLSASLNEAEGGGGGGGGGGYGGSGGNGCEGGSVHGSSNTSRTYGCGGSGGGGGGYGASGGNAYVDLEYRNTYGIVSTAGGGGGGYGGRGFDGYFYSQTACGGGGGGYGPNNYGCGGTYSGSKNLYPPKSGCVVISYVTKEVV